MPLELAPWIVPVMMLLGFLGLDRRVRTVRADLRRDREGRPAGLRQTLTGGNVF